MQALRHQMGLDRPYLVQLGDFLYKSFLKLDFGKSYIYKVPVFRKWQIVCPAP